MAGADEPRISTITDYDVPIPMRDGTILRAIVTRPAVEDAVPVVLVRTPYPLEEARQEVDSIGLARRGLAFVLQSVRGTGRSDGELSVFRNEGPDGFDTIAWCAEQPWSDGNVATLGRSYLAQAQVYAAGERPRALRAMALDVVADDPYEVQFTGGAANLGAGLGWAMAMSGVSLERCEARGEDVREDRERWIASLNDMPNVFRTTPLDRVPVVGRHLPAWAEVLAHPRRDEFWRSGGPKEREPIPTIVVAGWHDVFVRGSLSQFVRSRRHPASRLIVGPWSHTSAGAALGDAYYGAAASAPALGLDARRLDFLAAHLRGQDTGPGGAHVFVMGSNRWRDFPAWPPEATDLDLFLAADGRLAPQPPSDVAAPSSFTFDPNDPVPTVGGPNLLPWGDAMDGTGACDQRRLDARTDVLRFVTEPLERDVEVIGSVALRLFAATSAADTDWTGKLVDVYPDGRALNVVDSIVRARFRDPERDELLAPNESHEFVLDLGPTAQCFRAGHRIRVDVSSSNFPRFDRNPGTGGSSVATPASDFVTARQSVFHDAAHPSRLRLPVVAP